MRFIVHSETFLMTKEFINRNYSHWRKLRAILINLQRPLWSTHHIHQITTTLLPMIHQERYPEAIQLYNKLDNERIRDKQYDPMRQLHPVATCKSCRTLSVFKVQYSPRNITATCRRCNHTFLKYDLAENLTDDYEFIERLEK